MLSIIIMKIRTLELCDKYGLEGGVYITSVKQRVKEIEARHRISVEERVEKIGTRDKTSGEDTLDEPSLT